MSADLRHGRWQDVLADVTCDAFISDPPYGERTHAGQRHGRHDVRYDPNTSNALLSRRGFGYDHITPGDVAALVSHWSPRTRGWFCAFTSHDLIAAYSDALDAAGRYVFAPIACVQTGMNVRLAGDGPSNWTCWLVVARPRTMRAWGALPGAYVGSPHDPGTNQNDKTSGKTGGVKGAKPLWMMRAIVRDYSRPGDLVCDPYAGGGTTALACLTEGRRAIGAEVDPDTHAKATARLSTWQPSLFVPEIKAEAQDLFGGAK